MYENGHFLGIIAVALSQLLIVVCFCVYRLAMPRQQAQLVSSSSVRFINREKLTLNLTKGAFCLLGLFQNRITRNRRYSCSFGSYSVLRMNGISFRSFCSR